MIGDKKRLRQEQRKQERESTTGAVYCPDVGIGSLIGMVGLLAVVGAAAGLASLMVKAQDRMDAKEYQKMLPGLYPVT